jgi:hypothetical protein
MAFEFDSSHLPMDAMNFQMQMALKYRAGAAHQVSLMVDGCHSLSLSVDFCFFLTRGPILKNIEENKVKFLHQ